MLTQDDLKVAIIMMKRASCTGEESGAVCQTILKLESMYQALQPAPAEEVVVPTLEVPEEEEGDESEETLDG